jgi:hypothetical protein
MQKSKRPPDSDFCQQRLVTRPANFTSFHLSVIIIVLGIIFLPLGTHLLSISGDVIHFEKLLSQLLLINLLHCFRYTKRPFLTTADILQIALFQILMKENLARYSVLYGPFVKLIFFLFIVDHIRVWFISSRTHIFVLPTRELLSEPPAVLPEQEHIAAAGSRPQWERCVAGLQSVVPQRDHSAQPLWTDSQFLFQRYVYCIID